MEMTVMTVMTACAVNLLNTYQEVNMENLCYLTEEEVPISGTVLVGRLPSGEEIVARKLRKVRGQPRQWELLIDRGSSEAARVILEALKRMTKETGE